MKLRILILAAIALLPLVSCGNRAVSAQLDDIESYIHERPDSALAILQAIDKQNLTTRSLKAKYAVLYSAALDKNYIDTTDLSIIEPAVSYYRRHGSADEKMRAYFYRGRIHYNRKEDNEAMNSFLMALQDSSRAADNHYKDLVNSAISDIFSRNYNYEQELEYTATALRYARLAGDEVGVWKITGHLATSYANLLKWDEAEKTFMEYFEMPVLDSTLFYQKKLIYAQVLLFKSEQDPLQAIDIVESVARRAPDAMSVKAYCFYAYAQQLIGNTGIADGVMEQVRGFGKQKEVVDVWDYRIYKQRGEFDKAIEKLEQSLVFQDSVILSVLNQSLVQVQRDYYQSETDVLRKEKTITKQRTVLILTFSIALFGLLFALFHRNQRRSKARIDELSVLYEQSQNMVELQSAETKKIRNQLAQKEETLLSLRKQFATLYKGQFKSLNELCAAYLSPAKKDKKELLYNEAMRQVSIIGSDDEAEERFKAQINTSLDDILTKLQRDLPDLSKTDLRILMFLIVGFDAKTISCITGYSIGTVYTKKLRFRHRIDNLSSPDKDFYLEYL